MASIHETHAGVARVTPHGQLRPLHRAADDDARTEGPGQATAPRSDSGPVRSITRGEAEDPATGPGSNGPAARKRQHPPARNNRVFVIGSDGGPEDRPAAPAGGQRRPAGQQQHNRGTQPANRTAGDNELANRLDSVIAMLPPETGRDLRRRYHDPKELLRHATDELNRRNAAAARTTPEAQTPGNDQQPGAGGNGQSAESIEKRIADGMRALKLTTDEQTDLRRQYPRQTRSPAQTHHRGLDRAAERGAPRVDRRRVQRTGNPARRRM